MTNFQPHKLLFSCRFFLFALFLSTATTSSSQINVFSNFPGGNLILDRIKGDSIWVRPDLRDTKGDWFYWYFAVSNAKGRSLTFTFNLPNQFSRMGAAISTDGGQTWKWQGGNSVTTNRFTYSFTSADEVRFSMGMPYLQNNFDQFIRKYQNSPFVKLSYLTKTKKGRLVETITIKNPKIQPKKKVLIAARHHACEMMASYVLEGIVEGVLQSGWLKDNVEFLFVPFMDKDGVEDGDQGKNRFPRDHNRDYSQISVHETTSAMRSYIPVWSEKRCVMALDLHCPWIKDGNNEYIFTIESNDKQNTPRQMIFSDLIEKNNGSELKFFSRNFVKKGDFDWTLPVYPEVGTSFTGWAFTLEGMNMSTTIEIPYSYSSGQVVTAENCRAFGNDVAKAIEEYLKQLN